MDEQLLKQALDRLPHGPEFRFLDRVISLNPGVSGEGEHLVRDDGYFLRGHFPGNPLMPGVLLVEAAAQLAGVVAQSDPKNGVLPGLKLTAIRAVKILSSVKPGQLIHLQSEITGRMGNLIQSTVIASCAGKTLMTGEITLSGDRA